MIDLLTTTVSVLADPPKNSGPDFGKASPVGLLIVVILLIGVFFLVWSMNRQLKKVPKSFDPEPAEAEAEPEAAPEVDEAEAPAADTGKPASEPSG